MVENFKNDRDVEGAEWSSGVWCTDSEVQRHELWAKDCDLCRSINEEIGRCKLTNEEIDGEGEKYIDMYSA